MKSKMMEHDWTTIMIVQVVVQSLFLIAPLKNMIGDRCPIIHWSNCVWPLSNYWKHSSIIGQLSSWFDDYLTVVQFLSDDSCPNKGKMEQSSASDNYHHVTAWGSTQETWAPIPWGFSQLFIWLAVDLTILKNDGVRQWEGISHIWHGK
jgi:hypothetical protein